MKNISLFLVFAMLAIPSARAEVYITPDAFLAAAFTQSPPAPELLWLTGALAEQAKAVLGHDLPALQMRYWARDGRSAWILNEIGKTEPITIGIIIENDKITGLSVLEYRESRGGEVRHAFFTNQFIGLALTPETDLSEPVDGISGATLSVRALERMARFALLLHQKIPENGGTAHE